MSELVNAISEALIGFGADPSARAIGRLLRDHGIPVGDKNLRESIAARRIAPKTAAGRRKKPERLPHSAALPGMLPQYNAATRGRARAARDTVINSPSLLTSEDTNVSSDERQKPLKEVAPLPVMPLDLPPYLPDEIDALKRVALPFLSAFGNCKSDEALKKHGPAYTEALAIFRGRGVQTAAIWSAFCDLLASRSGRPVFGNEAKKALAFLPGRRLAAGQSNNGGEALDIIGNAQDPPTLTQLRAARSAATQ